MSSKEQEVAKAFTETLNHTLNKDGVKTKDIIDLYQKEAKNVNNNNGPFYIF